jgi:hypothetical protein
MADSVLEKRSATYPLEPISRAARWLLAGASLFVLLCIVAIAIYHRRDSYQVDVTSSVWTALAQQANQGTLYPPVFEGERYGGSRYMPAYFLLHAGLIRLMGDYLLAGKVLSGLVGLGYLVVLFLVLRRVGCSFTAALALSALALASYPIYGSLVSIRGDLLALSCQLAAVALVFAQGDRPGGEAGPTRYALAGVCCALGCLTKITAGWAPLAILCVSIPRRRLCAGVFLLTWLGAAALGAGAIYLASAGRVIESFRLISEPPLTMFLLLFKSPLRILRYFGPVETLMIPFALMELFLARRDKGWTVFHWGWLFCLPITLVIFADRGTIYNHLMDLTTLTIILVAILWQGEGNRRPAGVLLSGLMPWLVLWGMTVSWAREVGMPIREVIQGVAGDAPARPAIPLADIVPVGACILSDDPLIPLSRGQTPIVLDAYAFGYIDRKHPEWSARLYDRIAKREFDFIVLSTRLDQPREKVLGSRGAAVILENYRRLRSGDEFHVFVPRGK